VNNSRGITLIETLLAMTLGSVLVVGAMTLFSQARAAYRTAENVARVQENLRFARDMLRSDIQIANFWGRTHRAEHIDRAPGVLVRCRGRDVTDWALDISRAVEAHGDAFAPPCPMTDAAAESDILVTRHARPGITMPDAGAVQILSSGRGGIIFDHGNPAVEPPPGGALFDVVANAWYVSARSDYDPDTPALRRLSLVRGTMQDQEIIAGIESLRIELGLDTDGDNRVNAYVTGDQVDLSDPGINVVAVRMKLTARSGPPDFVRAETTRTIFLRNARRPPELNGEA
jgi:type IV pilus assembly protein PilW